MRRMKPLRAVREMMGRANTTQRKLSADIGRSESYVGATLSKGSSIEACNFVAMANAMDFRVIVEGHGISFELTPQAAARAGVQG